ncbi:indole-3-glycerol phosphate synthase TrpC [Thermophagus sp. OGC60D27]|uniref:indole-3-glycerol phosphate synthase TrpC n=1 Tax=Thermophagus sp. OGC60D27 TaxID=3458415 RepID=UPI00403792D9
MNILDKIVANKRKELQTAKQQVTIKELEYYRHFSSEVPSLKNSLKEHADFPVIAEFKRKSPSKGDINLEADLKEVITTYHKAAVAGISVLTDQTFFGGNNDDLSTARDLTNRPILRKEFIIDPYQVYEAKAIGASAILLIAAILNKKQARDLAALANYLGMEVLMEIHDKEEMDLLNIYVDLVGINNRNLKTFNVNLEHAANLASILPKEFLPIAESGIHSAADVLFLKEAGFKGFLMGEFFMKHQNPGKACIDLKEEISKIRI